MRLLALTCLAIFAAAALPAQEMSTADFPNASTVRSPDNFDHAAYQIHQRQLHDWLVGERVEGRSSGGLEVEIGAQELHTIEATPLTERRVRVGVAWPVSVPIDLSAAGIDDEDLLLGGTRRMADGGWVWSVSIQSPGAAALRIRFTEFFLSPGAELYVYTDAGHVLGPYSGRGPRGDGDFWTHSAFASDLHLQVRVPGPLPTGAAAPSFVIEEVAHIGSRFVLPGFFPDEDSGESFCSFNESCVENASCDASSAVNDARDAVAHILFRSGGFFYICTGGLLADTDGSLRPFFLTANHCLSRGKEARSLEAFFQFTTPCGGGCYDPSDQVPSTLGSTILNSDRTGDYTLLELAEPAPAGSAFLGWTAAPVAESHGADLFRISHPGGAPQAYSSHQVDTTRATCGSWPRGEWIYSEDTFGATEGGSSGSPVVNSAGQVVGQLSGACGFRLEDVCDAASNATVDGAFASYYSEIEPWLGPSGGGGGDTCDLLQSGASCSADSECCSGRCKGPRADKTCK